MQGLASPEFAWLDDLHLIDARATSRLLGVPLSTVYYLASSGELPHVRIGRRTIRFVPSHVSRYVQARTQGASGAA